MCSLQDQLLLTLLSSSGHSVGPCGLTERDAYSNQGSRSHAPRLCISLRGEEHSWPHTHWQHANVNSTIITQRHSQHRRTNASTHTQSCSRFTLRHNHRHMKTHSESLCVFVPPLFVLVVVHWIYVLALRGQCMWEPNTLELWEMKSKVKARNTLQCVLCMGICVYWRTRNGLVFLGGGFAVHGSSGVWWKVFMRNLD